MSDSFRLLGLAPPRAAWFRSVAVWSTSGALPAEFLKCVSAEDLRARLASQGPFSAMLVDAALPSVDRDLLATAEAAGCAVIVVDDPRVARDWYALGASKVMTGDFGRDDLVATLGSCARRVLRGAMSGSDLLDPVVPPTWRGSLVGVTGPGGTGASVAAMALAQAFGDDVRQSGLVLLADLRLRAEQAMLHDVCDVGPGIQELAEAHRAGQVSCESARTLAFAVESRRYHLLLGLRQPRFWPAIRPRSFDAALDTLLRSYRVVVCDIDCDLEGEDASGSIDVEERNTMSRSAAAAADVVFAVGSPSMKGVHALVRVISELCAFGVDVDRILPVFSRSPRSPRVRAQLGTAVSELSSEATLGRLPPPVHLAEVHLEECVRDVRRLPASLGAPLVGAYRAVVDGAGTSSQRSTGTGMAYRVKPGSLGGFDGGREAAG